MKARFTSADVVAAVCELQKLIGMRVVRVYDVDVKTYLFKLTRQEEKRVLLFESGIRIHTTDYDWPKGSAPSTFSMKLRKHLNNKRIESVTQLGGDRIIDIQFGINEAAYHVIIEMYDRGNVVLTDGAYLILNILRPRQAGAEDVRFAVRETYPVPPAVASVTPAVTIVEVRQWLEGAKDGDTIRKVLVPKVRCGPAILDHCLQSRNIATNTKISKLQLTDEFVKCLHEAIVEGYQLLDSFKKPGTCYGVITLKVEKRIQPAEDGSTEIVSYNEFHPFAFKHIEGQRVERFDTFLQAVDAFFSRQEEQKITMAAHRLEKEAVKKLQNIKLDHEKRVQALESAQKTDVEKAELIESNLDLVEQALFAVRSAIASQMSWDEIANIIKDARAQGDPVAACIKELYLNRNHFAMYLSNPFEDSNVAPALVEIDIDLSAYANAEKYFGMKKQAAKKQQKTLESSAKALKSAQKTTREVLRQVELTTNIARSRKTLWFEKFYWFISSENYLVIGGRDAQQNEIIVKRYLNKGDVYVHADLHGASSVVIKNPSGEPIPPKTLTEAGTMAICYSAAWEAKVITTAWWVDSHQVSKTAPTGEYLSQGSFMVRGKKNFLPPLYLIMGFGFMFRLDEESISRHQDDRKVRTLDDVQSAVEDPDENQDKEEIEMSSSEDEAEDAEAFPDTQIRVLEPISEKLLQGASEEGDDENIIVYSQATKQKVVVIKKQNNRKKLKGQDPKLKQPAPIEVQPVQQPSSQKKKISKAKQRKIKQRYGDQDDEERELKMRLLASAGKQDTATTPAATATRATASVATTAAKKQNDHSENTARVEQSETKQKQHVHHGPAMASEDRDETDPDNSVSRSTLNDQGETKIDSKTSGSNHNSTPTDAGHNDNDEVDQHDDDDDEGGGEAEAGEDSPDDLTAILNSLTGVPVAEDTLLYAVPVCGPYSTMTNYKYKVKLIPGTNRRGKASKVALNMFQHDKSATPREKDLLRAAKDQEVARNMPGKVKMSAPNLQKHRK